MADDRLDDAIDAVVRAVDRIERATRSVTGAPPSPPVAADGSASPAAPEPHAQRATQFSQPHPMVEPHAPLDAPQPPAQAEYLRGTTNFWSTVRDVPVAPPAQQSPPQGLGHELQFGSAQAPAVPEQAQGLPQGLAPSPSPESDSQPSGAPHDPGSGLGPGAQSTAEFSALGAATLQSYAAHGASPQVHELVGRIVGRMQSLEDHLAAAGALRVEISELVARLAAAASKPR